MSEGPRLFEGPQPYAGFATGVRPEWVDYNGHLTDWAYAVVCSMANEALLDALDLGAAYRERTGCAMYTVEAHLRVPRRGRAGRAAARGVRRTTADAKRLRVRTSLRAGDVEVLAAEHLYLHVDGTHRPRRPLPLTKPTVE